MTTLAQITLIICATIVVCYIIGSITEIICKFLNVAKDKEDKDDNYNGKRENKR